MIGVVSGWLWILLKKINVHRGLALPIVGFVGSMTNTVFVMGSIYFLLAKDYAAVKSVAVDAVWGLVMGTVLASGVPEAVTAAVIVTFVGGAMFAGIKRHSVKRYLQQ